VSQLTVAHDPQADLDFLGGRAVGEAAWEVPVLRSLVSPTGGLYGGAGLAAVVAAMEVATGRPLRWVTCQFSSSAEVGETLSLRVAEDARGHRTSQAHTVVTAGERVVLRASAALGEARPDAPAHHWLEMPEVPAPDDCEAPEFPFPLDVTGTAVERSDRRVARRPGQADSGEPAGPGFGIALWSRVVGHVTASPAMLAWVADMVPMGIGAGLGTRLGGSSLDNTLRMASYTDAEWVLLDIRPTSIAEGYGHGVVHLWAPDGRLLASGSQTAAMRPLRL
jgi:acyl-CoA thioesterase II